MSSDSWSFRKQHTRLDEDALEREKQREEKETALIFAILIGAFAAFGIILLANSDTRQRPSQISDCASVEPTTARLACFDELSRSSAAPPFKGAPPAQLDGKQ
jgi:hypothetical protein